MAGGAPAPPAIPSLKVEAYARGFRRTRSTYPKD